MHIVTTDYYFRSLAEEVSATVARDWGPNPMPDLIVVDDDNAPRALADLGMLKQRLGDPIVLVACRKRPDTDALLYRDASLLPFDSGFSSTLYHAAMLSLAGFSVRPDSFERAKPCESIAEAMVRDSYAGDEDYRRLLTLSHTERKVLRLLIEALSNKEIGRCLAISDNTVRIHMRSIFLKLNMQNRTQAALLATRYRGTDVLADEPADAGGAIVPSMVPPPDAMRTVA